MQAEILNQEAVSATFAVNLEQKEVAEAFKSTYRELARDIRIPGFRPGRAPRGVIDAKVGKEAIVDEVKDSLIRKFYPKAVQQLELTPVNVDVKADDPVEGETFQLEFTVDLYPKITLPDINEIVIDSEVEAITEDMVNQELEQIQFQQATLVPVDRPVAEQDQVLVSRPDAEDASEWFPFELQQMSEEFRDQFIGKSIDDEVLLKPLGGGVEEQRSELEEVVDEALDQLEAGMETLAEDAEGSEDSAELSTEEDAAEAATADEAESEDAELPEIRLVIRDIQERELPEQDDELAITLGFESWEQVVTQVRDSLQEELNRRGFDEQCEEFIEKMMLEVEAEIPESMLKRREQHLKDQLESELEQEGKTLTDYLNEREEEGQTRESFYEELKEAAQNDVKRDLLLETILEQRGTKLSDEEFESNIAYLAYSRQSDPRKFKREQGEAWLENYRFILERNRAWRDTVRELLGASDSDDDEEEAQVAAASVEVEAEMEEKDD